MEIPDIVKKIVSEEKEYSLKEIRTSNNIQTLLKQKNIPFRVESFDNSFPFFKKVKLVVDGVEIDSLGSCFSGGKFEGRGKELLGKKIFYRKDCTEIAVTNFTKELSISIREKDVEKVLKSEMIVGEVDVEQKEYPSSNILVGNIVNPRNIFVAHFDSIIGLGIIDNLCGVALLIKYLLSNKEVLNNSLFLFSGSEELSYEFPYYWGKGFREFEKLHKDILCSSSEIIIVDGVGIGSPNFVIGKDKLFDVFPIQDYDLTFEKMKLLQGDNKKINSIYHSNLDDLRVVNVKDLNDAYIFLEKSIINN